MAESRRRFALLVYQHVSYLIGSNLVDSSLPCDVWNYRKERDEGYARRLGSLSKAYLQIWEGFEGVSNDLLLFDKPLLPREFRFDGKEYPH